MGRAVGIDLGTTNSCIATLEGGQPTVIVNAEGARTTPSVVAFSKSGEILVGEVAKRQAVTNVDRTISSVKRHMGTDWTVEIDGKKWTPQEISAQVLMKLKRDAEAYLGEPVTDAVITCPAYFNDAQRQATKDAGTIAGLNVLRIINEPTAAALAYGLEKGKEDETILVFDLGGGTFDVSLLEIGKDDDGFSTIQVQATNGDNHLGGDDWDQKIIDWLVGEVKNKYGIDLSKDKIALQRLKEAAEQAKKELSSSSSTSISMQYLAMTPDGTPVHLDETLTRAHFESMTSDLLGRCRTPFNNVLHDAGIGVSDIDHVVLVGGSTRMPAVKELVKELTGGKEANQSVNPDEVVAVGAAVQSGVSAMQAVREGGVFGGLWQLAKANGVGLVIDLKQIPVKQETIEVCEFYDVNPYELLSGGSMLMITQGGTRLVSQLAEQGISAAVIGRTTDNNDRILVNDEEKRFLEPARHDSLYRVLATS